MRVSAYDMYIQNYHMSSEAWSTMLTEFQISKLKLSQNQLWML